MQRGFYLSKQYSPKPHTVSEGIKAKGEGDDFINPVLEINDYLIV